MFGALGLLAKVYSAKQTGKGGQVDVALFDTMLSQLNYKAAAYLNGGVVPTRQPSGGHSFYVPAQLFPTADGWLALFITHDEFWVRLCNELGEPGWGTDPRWATMHARSRNRAEVIAMVTTRLAEASALEWQARLRPLELPVAAVVGLDAALDSDYVAHRGMVETVQTREGPLRMVGNPIRTGGVGPFTLPPRLHEHTAEVLGEQL